MPNRSNPALLKADTAVKRAIKIPFNPSVLKKTNERIIVPNSSQMNVEISTNLIISLVFILLSTPKDSRTSNLFLNDRLPFVKEIKLTNNSAYPNPPIWNKHINTICPKIVRFEHISIGDNPVTQTADVETNKASIKDKSLVVEIGRSKRIVPKIISEKKPKAKSSEDGTFLSFCL